MSDDDKVIDKTLLERIFAQLDKNTDQITELIRITGEHSSVIGVLKKIILTVFVFVFLSFLGTIFMVSEINLKELIKNDLETRIEQHVEEYQYGDDENDEGSTILF